MLSDKINSHKIINRIDINRIINMRLKELNLRSNNIVRFVKNDSSVDFMAYDIYSDHIEVDRNFKKSIVKDLVNDFSIKLVKNTNNNIFIRDVYNLELISSLYHELRHKEQYNLYFDERSDYNYLLKLSLEYMQVNYDFYSYAHGLYFSEYDAEINCFKKMLEDVQYEYFEISDNALYYMNSIIAYAMLKARGYVLFNKDLVKKHVFNSPLHFLKYLTIIWYKDNKKYKSYYNKNMGIIKRIRDSVKSEYDKLIIGDNITEELINELYLIAICKIKTKNIFKYLESKYNIEKGKSLCKKIQS